MRSHNNLYGVYYSLMYITIIYMSTKDNIYPLITYLGMICTKLSYISYFVTLSVCQSACMQKIEQVSPMSKAHFINV